MPPSRIAAAVALVIAGVTAGVYWPALGAAFVRFDTAALVTHNPELSKGLSLDGLRWAFSTTLLGNWHPLTWLSLLADWQLFGMSARAFHATNLLLHVAGSVLLFGVMRALTGALWRSAFVAAVFALHPAHVESVAWVSERKDVLSGVFFMLTVAAWLRALRSGSRPLLWVGVSLLLAAGLMSKSMLVTLPFVLLLLDDWPLDRLRERGEGGYSGARVRRALVEKLPLFALVIAFSVIALLTQSETLAVKTTQAWPLGLRVENALVSYVRYLGMAVWPVDLAPFYPFGRGPSHLAAALCAALLAAITAGVLWAPARLRYLRTGWLWYLGTLVPVIGLVQVGDQALADRYTYLPYVGLSIVVAWGVPDLLARFGAPRALAAAAALVAALGLAFATAQQVRLWRDPITLWTHAVEVTGPNAVAQNQLGVAYLSAGDHASAERHFRRAREIDPAWPASKLGLGMALNEQGRSREAARLFAEGLSLDPLGGGRPDALAKMLLVVDLHGSSADARGFFVAAYRASPETALRGFEPLLARGGGVERAARGFLEGVARSHPDFHELQHVLARHSGG